MAIVDVEFIEESQARYLTYALSVVNSRALPDVRDGLKPVQRRILYAMATNLRLTPDHHYRKSAAVVGEVLARYHPHGDSACYEAMVRMAQDFSLRYPLVDGQGNFGSLDGDSAAAYRYTEARLTPIALEVIGDIGQNTVAERDNFDQTTSEPVVLPSRVPNLLMNGATGIAVGMATSIPPHNLKELVRALQMLLEDADVADSRIFTAIKGPDFPTGCSILNTKQELKQIYSTGRGAIRMRADYKVEKGNRGKRSLVVTSVPYGVDKSVIVEKIADLIIARKLPQLDDVRDESTDEVRIVLELTSDADEEKAMAYLFKHTALQQNFNVNLTALVPTDNPLSGKPVLLSLRRILEEFIEFRKEVTRKKLLFEKGKLEERIHLLEGLVTIFDAIDEVIRIVRKSSGRKDAAEKLRKRFKLSEIQSYFIVDLRIYQLSKTSIEEIEAELAEKLKRVRHIDKILKSEKILKNEISIDLGRVSEEYGDPRLSNIVSDYEEVELDKDDYVRHEDVHVVVTRDGWLKRIRNTNDPKTTRIREGDEILFTEAVSTKKLLAIFSNQGNVFVLPVFDLLSTSGFGEPVQKTFKFQDGEAISTCMTFSADEDDKELFIYSEQGYGFRIASAMLGVTKKTGKRIMRLGDGDRLSGVVPVTEKLLFTLTQEGYGLLMMASDVSLLSGPGKGVVIQKVPKDKLLVVKSVKKKERVKVAVKKGMREVEMSSMTINGRAKRGLKVIKRGAPVIGIWNDE